jgi:SAM-dependent methyltransferase
MDSHMKQNLDLWNEITPIHVRSRFYDLEGFKAGRNSLKPIELDEVGDVKGKTLLHLQCHFGMDTLSWARLGASVTGVDFSDEAIHAARNLSRELDVPARFILSNVYDLPGLLQGEFDVVYTSYGVLCWLPDLSRWAAVIAGFLKPGGTFYIVEGHPILNIFDNSRGATGLAVTQSYFHSPEPIRWEPEGDYAENDALVVNPSYEWTHSLGEIVNALIGAGLRIEFLHEFPMSSYSWAPFTKQDKEGWWRIDGDRVPMLFSIKATKVT